MTERKNVLSVKDRERRGMGMRTMEGKREEMYYLEKERERDKEGGRGDG